mmetsp:Transcript_49465/g.115678  ORF Transcript_49465/g.115678 Transcript_49465/m.115678 type:complete len:290 (-) Transcript_49465:159-1028(-)
MLLGLLYDELRTCYNNPGCADEIGQEWEEGPGVPYSMHISGLVGVILHPDELLDPLHEPGPFACYKLDLYAIPEIFQDNWNPYFIDGYHEKLWSNTPQFIAMRTGQQAQHMVYYGMTGHLFMRSRVGVLEDGGDFFKLLDRGFRKQKRRVYTYSLRDDGLYFSETGDGMTDLSSKHVVHAKVAEKVRCAGTFRILEDPDMDEMDRRRCSLLIDNDSGTYRPKREHLPLLKQVLEVNLPGMKVYAHDCTKPQPPETLTLLGPNEMKDSPDVVYCGTGQYTFVQEDPRQED